MKPWSASSTGASSSAAASPSPPPRTPSGRRSSTSPAGPCATATSAGSAPSANRRPADGRWFALGRRYREQVRRGPFLPVFTLTVVEVEEGRRVAWAARYLWVDAVHAWEVEPDGDGAILTSEESFTGPRVIMAIARVVFRIFTVERMTDRQLEFMAGDALGPPGR